MPVRYTDGAKGPFDALQTKADGIGKWWEGMDPADLYGPRHSTDCSNQQCNNSAFGTQFMYRVDVGGPAEHRRVNRASRQRLMNSGGGAYRFGDLEFCWDDRKAAANQRRHGVGLEGAVTVFADPLARVYDDPTVFPDPGPRAKRELSAHGAAPLPLHGAGHHHDQGATTSRGQRSSAGTCLPPPERARTSPPACAHTPSIHGQSPWRPPGERRGRHSSCIKAGARGDLPRQSRRTRGQTRNSPRFFCLRVGRGERPRF
jgi:hypothetical protein